MLSELKIAARGLRKSPGFTLAAVAALALGIGANSAVFSLVRQVLVNPDGILDPERVIALRVRYETMRNISTSATNFKELQSGTHVFEYTALADGEDFNYTGGNVPERLEGASVTVDWFRVFGAKPRLGRTFTPEEDQPNANNVVVLSDATWKRLLGADPNILGRKIELNRKLYEIIGVMEPGFRFPRRVDLWAPLGLTPDRFQPQNRFNESFFGVARLKEGLTPQHAVTWAQVLTERARSGNDRGAQYARDSGWGMMAVPLVEQLSGEARTPLLVLLGAVGFVLLIACSNIAGLMLARLSGRAQETAVRRALGADLWALLRLSLAESLLLSAAGAIAGVLLGWLLLRGFVLMAGDSVTGVLNTRLGLPVLVFTIGVAMFAGILFGLAPLWHTLRLDPQMALRSGGRAGSPSQERQRLRFVLVVGETALALVLLVGAGLLLRSLSRLQQVDPGFQSRGVAIAMLALPDSQYKEPEKRSAFFDAVLTQLRAQPGVKSAALAQAVPFSGNQSMASFNIFGRPTPPGDPGPHGQIRYVGSEYFSTLGIPVKQGRAIGPEDIATSQPVAVIDEMLAKQYWPNEDPIGKQIRTGRVPSWATIVGVVANVRHVDLGTELTKGTYYYPYAQRPLPFGTLIARTDGDAVMMRGALERAIQSVDSKMPVQVRYLERLMEDSLAQRRTVMRLLGFFATLALFLAAIGLYGMISYSVAQRTREIGIRMALGAERSEVVSMVLRQGLVVAVVGITVGLIASLVLARLIQSQLFGVTAFDLPTFGAMAVVLLGAALLASFLPARRATQVNPIEALRYD